MTSTTQDIAEASARLLEAAARRVPCAPVRDLIGSNDIGAAYAVQALGTADRLASGAVITGRKIGLTSEAVQRQIGVDQPDLGYLFADMEFVPSDVIPMDRLLQPKAEAEVAFVLARDIPDGEITREELRAAIAYVVPALEIVDSRIADWDITFGDTVADNGSSALYVLGEQRVSLDAIEPVDVEMIMSRNGEQVSEGTGAACLGDPLNAVHWLARTAADFGDPLRAGQVILSGALGPMTAIGPGDTVTAVLTGLGTVTATFAKE